MGKPAVVVDNVSMKFNLSKEKVDNLKDYLILGSSECEV